MKITICDFCKRGGNEIVVNRWVRIRWAEGTVSTLLHGTDRELELCEDCFRLMTTKEQ